MILNNEVRSLTLLKMLVKAQLLDDLAKVRREEVGGRIYPIYIFTDEANVRAVLNAYKLKYGEDSRENDDQALWATYKTIERYTKTVQTKKPRVVERAFDEGYPSCIVGVDTDRNFKSVFILAYNEDIERIKNEEDERAQREWQERQKKKSEGTFDNAK